jgi:integrase
MTDNIVFNREIKEDMRHTSNDVFYDFNKDVWRLSSPTIRCVLNFEKLKLYAADEFIFDFKRVIALYLRESSAQGLLYIFRAFKLFLQITYNKHCRSVAIIKRVDVQNFMNNNSIAPYYKDALKTLVFNFNKYSFAFIDEDSIIFCKNFQSITREDIASVLTANPYTGPYTDVELNLIICKIKEKYMDDSVNLKDCVLAYLCFFLALRPSQVALLKIKDYYLKEDSILGMKYFLNVPRVKQKGVKPRELFRERELHPILAEMIEEWISSIKQKYEVKSVSFVDNMPLFPTFRIDEFGDYRFHQKAGTISKYITDVGGKIQVKSPRTGKIMRLTANRSRKTYGTRLAIEGHGPQTIAYLLDHSNMANVQHYVKVAKEIVTEISDAISQDIAPLISVFKGEVKTNLKPIPGTNRIASDVSLDFDTGMCIDPTGCGAYSKDNTLESILVQAPYYCYICPYFKAFSHIETHKFYLQSLLSHREVLFLGGDSEGCPGTENYLIAASLDNVILAIEEVIDIIESNKINSPYNIE